MSVLLQMITQATNLLTPQIFPSFFNILANYLSQIILKQLKLEVQVQKQFMYIVNSKSTIDNQAKTGNLKLQQKPMKVSSIVSTEDAIYMSNQDQKIHRKQKSAMLKETLEEKIRNMKILCQKIKMRSGNTKTPQESEPKSSNMNIIYNFNKQKNERSTQESDKSSFSTSLSKSDDFTNSLSEEKPEKRKLDRLNSLKQVRESDSFMMDDDKQFDEGESIVEQHGMQILNWQICNGKAGEFKILKYLDEGIFGKVYLAESRRNNAIYSIKSIYRSKIDEKYLQQLIRQVKIQSFLIHPHVVNLYHFFVDEDAAYLVLQPCLGKNLYQNLKEVGRFPEKTVREYVRQICLGVEYMHKNDIIHRDLKPQNILLHENMIKICDFGWAIHSPLLRGTQCGTPLYVSPEIVSKRPYDSKIDIWSIGVLTYQMLYGTIPFQIRNPNDMNKIIEQEVYFSKDASISQQAKDFIKSCLEKNPNDRPTARQLLEHEFMQKIQPFRLSILRQF